MMRRGLFFMGALVAAMASLVHAGDEQLCSIPPGTYTAAKASHPELAFALAELEQHGIATWYTDRFSNGDFSAIPKKLVATCPPSSRMSIVVYGLPNKDCEAKESMVGTYNQNSAMYQAFISTLQQAVGDRKVLYVLEPDAVALLAGGGCAKSFGYGENLALAVKMLSQNPNADIYVDVGHWMLGSDSNLANVAAIVRQLAAAGRVKGITINTSNYRSNAELSSGCAKFRGATSGLNLHCIIDTSRNYNGPSAQDEWCNFKNAAIGKVPTGNTGDPNIDYYVWIKPPGDSDGTCQHGRTSDALIGPGAGAFSVDFFKTLWNEGSLVKEKGMPKIDGTIRPVQVYPTTTTTTPTPTTTTPTTDSPTTNTTTDQQQTNNTTSGEGRSMGSGSLATTTTSSTGSAAADEIGAGVVVPPQGDPVFDNTPDATTQAPPETQVQEATTKSSQGASTNTGIIVLACMVAAAVVALVAVVAVRTRQRSIEETKTPLEPRIHYLSNTPSSLAQL